MTFNIFKFKTSWRFPRNFSRSIDIILFRYTETIEISDCNKFLYHIKKIERYPLYRFLDIVLGESKDFYFPYTTTVYLFNECYNTDLINNKLVKNHKFLQRFFTKYNRMNKLNKILG